MLAFILVSTFYSLSVNPIDLGKYFKAKLTQAVGIGTSTSVAPNPINSLALQLKQKEDALNKREAQLDAQKYPFGNISQRTLFLMMISGIFILFILIIVNYILDYRNFKKSKKQ